MTAVSSEGRRQGNSGPSESEERNLRDSTCLAFRPARHSVIVIIMSEPDTNTDATTSPSSVNGLTESLSSLSDDLEHLRSLLAHDIPGDAADQEIGALLQELERADSIGENVEERIDGILETLDTLLVTLQPDGDPQTVEAQGGATAPQGTGNDLGR